MRHFTQLGAQRPDDSSKKAINVLPLEQRQINALGFRKHLETFFAKERKDVHHL